MARPSPLLWLAVILILLLPTAAGRFLLDLAGGLMLAFFTLPLILAGLGWLGWRVLQSKMITCTVCGANTIANTMNCPICGSEYPKKEDRVYKASKPDTSIPAKSATIDIIAEDANDDI